MIGKLAAWVDDRLDAGVFVRSAGRKVFPTHWSFLLGEIALYSFAVLVVTGVLLTLFYVPSQDEILYTGSHVPLQGVEMSRAYHSVLDLSFDVPAGLLLRQVHHWTALVFVAAVTTHLARVYLTGAFRRPRELNWVVGVTLLLLAMALGFTGYSLPDDLLSGTGLRIGHAILESVPVVGADLASMIFGGAWPGEQIIARLYPLHIFVLPGALAGLLVAHLAILWRQKHTHLPGPGSREGNIIGERLWPRYVLKSAAIASATTGVLVGLGGLVQINPVWVYGPYRPADITIAAQPDWYIGFLEGALRLMPAWEFRAGGVMIPNPFFPGVLFPLFTVGVLYAVPWVHARLTGDREEHHLAERPRDAPVRTGIGVGFAVGYAVLLIAGAQDLISAQLDVPVERLRTFLQVSLLVAPVIVGIATTALFRGLRDSETHPLLDSEPMTIERTDHGAYRHAADQDVADDGHRGAAHQPDGDQRPDGDRRAEEDLEVRRRRR